MSTEPLACVSGQFALAGSTFTPVRDDVPSEAGLRPWGLRRAQPAGPGVPVPPWSYDEQRQLAVDPSGTPLIDLPVCQPTAKTTSIKDGEDPPSSEDWHND